MQIQAKTTFSTNPKDIFKSAKKILEKPNRKKGSSKTNYDFFRSLWHAVAS